MESKANNKYSNLPTGWEMKKLKDVAINCGDYGANAPALPYKAGDIRYIRITDIDDYGHLISDDKASLDETIAQNYLLKDNDILFARTGDTVGKSLLYKSSMGRAAYAGYLIRFTLDEKQIFPEYFDAIAKSDIFETFKVSMKRIGAKPNINSREYGIFRFPMPLNLGEQKEIAKLFSKVDEAIASVQNSIAAAERLKKSLMQNLLTGKMKPDGTFRTPNEFYIDEKFGKVPVGWEVKKVKDLFFMNQDTLSNKTDADYKFRYITIEAVNTESIDFESCPEFSFKESPGRARRIINDYDILISGVRPNLKAFAIYRKPNSQNWICSTGFHVLTAKDNVCPQFFFYQILSSIGASQFHSWVTGSNYPAIGDSDMRNMLLYTPPYKEQLFINQKFESISKTQKAKQEKIAVLERLKKSLMQNLLTGRTRLFNLNKY